MVQTRTRVLQVFAVCALLCSAALGLFVACDSKPMPTEKGRDAGVVDQDNTEPLNVDSIPRCIPNNDGVIAFNEVRFVTGAAVSVKRNKPGTQVTIDQKGRENSEGVIVWDFRKLAAPEYSKVRTVAPQGKWFSKSFPGATLLTPVRFRNVSGVSYQVLRVAQQTMFLEGVASEIQKPEKDKVFLKYETSVPLLRFPLRLGKEWVVTSKSKGSVGGLPVTSTDVYQIRVAARGSVRLPDIQFDNALRIEIVIRQTLIGGVKRSLVQVLYFHECFGEIVRFESKENETNTKFTQAALVRYISF